MMHINHIFFAFCTNCLLFYNRIITVPKCQQSVTYVHCTCTKQGPVQINVSSQLTQGLGALEKPGDPTS